MGADCLENQLEMRGFGPLLAGAGAAAPAARPSSPEWLHTHEIRAPTTPRFRTPSGVATRVD